MGQGTMPLFLTKNKNHGTERSAMAELCCNAPICVIQYRSYSFYETTMNEEARNKIKQLSDVEITFEPGWTWKIWEDVQDIIKANEWESDEVVEKLPEKVCVVYLLANLGETINNDGLLSVFYNETLYEIKRLRHAIKLSGSKELGDLFDKAFQLVKTKFTWTDEHANFNGHMEERVHPYEFFDEITDRTEEIENQISDILFHDEFDKLLEHYVKS